MGLGQTGNLSTFINDQAYVSFLTQLRVSASLQFAGKFSLHFGTSWMLFTTYGGQTSIRRPSFRTEILQRLGVQPSEGLAYLGYPETPRISLQYCTEEHKGPTLRCEAWTNPVWRSEEFFAVNSAMRWSTKVRGIWEQCFNYSAMRFFGTYRRGGPLNPSVP